MRGSCANFKRLVKYNGAVIEYKRCISVFKHAHVYRQNTVKAMLCDSNAVFHIVGLEDHRAVSVGRQKRNNVYASVTRNVGIDRISRNIYMSCLIK